MNPMADITAAVTQASSPTGPTTRSSAKLCTGLSAYIVAHKTDPGCVGGSGRPT